MKFSTSCLLVSLTSFVSVLAENSPKFTLDLTTPYVSTLTNYNLFLNDNLLSVQDVSNSCEGYIHENGTLMINDKAVGQGRNYLTTAPQTSSWTVTSPWTISSGVLKLDGNSTFFAVPEDSSSNTFVLSSSVRSVSQGISVVNIQPILSDGSILQTWPKSSSLRGGKLAATIVVPIVAVLLISSALFVWFRVRKQSLKSKKEEQKAADQQNADLVSVMSERTLEGTILDEKNERDLHHVENTV